MTDGSWSKNREHLLPPYTRFSKEEIRFKFYYVQTLYAFLLMYLAFNLYLEQKIKAPGDDDPWKASIDELRPKLEALITRYSQGHEEKQ